MGAAGEQSQVTVGLMGSVTQSQKMRSARGDTTTTEDVEKQAGAGSGAAESLALEQKKKKNSPPLQVGELHRFRRL